MEIETKTASLETFSVTVRALHVNGKQMTLAVFRQLPIRKEKPDDEKWGVVRYVIKDQGDIWLVFSHNKHLFRRPLDERAHVSFLSLNRLQRDLEKARQSKSQSQREYKGQMDSHLKSADAFRETAAAVPFVGDYFYRTPEACVTEAERYMREREDARQRLGRIEDQYNGEIAAIESTIAQIDRNHEEEIARSDRDRMLIVTLPQLFIAV